MKTILFSAVMIAALVSELAKAGEECQSIGEHYPHECREEVLVCFNISEINPPLLRIRENTPSTEEAEISFTFSGTTTAQLEETVETIQTRLGQDLLTTKQYTAPGFELNLFSRGPLLRKDFFRPTNYTGTLISNGEFNGNIYCNVVAGEGQ